MCGATFWCYGCSYHGRSNRKRRRISYRLAQDNTSHTQQAEQVVHTSGSQRPGRETFLFRVDVRRGLSRKSCSREYGREAGCVRVSACRSILLNLIARKAHSKIKHALEPKTASSIAERRLPFFLFLPPERLLSRMPAHASKSCLCVRSSVKESLRLERYHPYFLPELRDSRHVQLPFAEVSAHLMDSKGRRLTTFSQYTHSIQTEVITVLSAAQSLRLVWYFRLPPGQNPQICHFLPQAREMAFKAALKIQNDVENSVQHNEHVVVCSLLFLDVIADLTIFRTSC